MIWDGSIIFWTCAFILGLGNVCFSCYGGFWEKEGSVKNLLCPLFLFVKAGSFTSILFLNFPPNHVRWLWSAYLQWKKPRQSEVYNSLEATQLVKGSVLVGKAQGISWAGKVPLCPILPFRSLGEKKVGEEAECPRAQQWPEPISLLSVPPAIKPSPQHSVQIII